MPCLPTNRSESLVAVGLTASSFGVWTSHQRRILPASRLMTRMAESCKSIGEAFLTVPLPNTASTSSRSARIRRASVECLRGCSALLATGSAIACWISQSRSAAPITSRLHSRSWRSLHTRQRQQPLASSELHDKLENVFRFGHICREGSDRRGSARPSKATCRSQPRRPRWWRGMRFIRHPLAALSERLSTRLGAPPFCDCRPAAYVP